MTYFDITIHEGRNRQIRRMCDYIGFPVRNLKRIKFGTLSLKGLSKGKMRELNEDEAETLKKAASLMANVLVIGGGLAGLWQALPQHRAAPKP